MSKKVLALKKNNLLQLKSDNLLLNILNNESHTKDYPKEKTSKKFGVFLHKKLLARKNTICYYNFNFIKHNINLIAKRV